MKKIFFLILFCNYFVTNDANAQIKKNTFVAETRSSYSRSTQTTGLRRLSFNGDVYGIPIDETSTKFLSSTQIGYTLFKNFTVGLAFKYGLSKEKFITEKLSSIFVNSVDTVVTVEITTAIIRTELVPGIYIQKYFRISNKFYVVSHLNLYRNRQKYREIESKRSIEFSTNTGEYPVYHAKTNKWSIGLSTSILFRLKDKIGIQLKFAEATYVFNHFLFPDLFNTNHPYPSFQTKKNPLDLNIDINPASWEYGLVLFF